MSLSLINVLIILTADAVLEARVKTITRLIEACHAIMHKYISSPRPLCENFEHEEECDALVIGYENF